VYDNNMNIVTQALSTVKIVSNTISAPKNILTIGDSLTLDKPWLSEVRTLSSNQISMVGTMGTAPLKHEGRSGWSAGTYLTANGSNPFWDGSKFDWGYYKTQTGITPDAVQIFLGTNGMALDPTVNAGNIKQIVDYIRQDDATIPIYVVYTLYRGNQNGIGQEAGTGIWKLEEDRKVFNLMVKLKELLSGYSNLHFVPISTCHDSEYNFGAVATPVNPRAVQTELLPEQATHPQLQGYLQIADIMFSVFAAHQ
jgi:lysophospholipase L1-like esterase